MPLRSLFADNGIETVIDVGANVGHIATMLGLIESSVSVKISRSKPHESSLRYVRSKRSQSHAA
jgi:hypothetical protein